MDEKQKEIEEFLERLRKDPNVTVVENHDDEDENVVTADITFIPRVSEAQRQAWERIRARQDDERGESD